MKPSLIRRLLAFTKPYRHYLFAALLLALASVALGLYTPILIGSAVDLIVGPGEVNFAAILPVLIQIAVVTLSGALFTWLMNLCTNALSYGTVKRLRTSIFAKLGRTPLAYLDGKAHGDLISRVVNDIDQISDGLIQGFSQLFTGIVTIGGTLAFMLSISPWIALVVVCLTPVSLFVASFIARRTAGAFSEQAKVRGELGGYIEELISGQKVVKAFSYEAESAGHFDEINSRLYDAGVKAQFYSSTTNPCTRFVNALVYAAVGVAGALAVIGGAISVGQLSSFLSYANQYTKPFNEISGVVTELQTALASARRVFEVLDEPAQSADVPDALVLTDCEGQVDAAHVYFSYTPERPLIEDFNLCARPGQRIAIVGPTGCGKTTLINLLMRFYECDQGTISLDGIPIRDITRASLRAQYGMVLQQTWIFSGTVRENILYGNPQASEQEMIDAAKAAHIHTFITRLPQGYDTPLGAAIGISEGQKQLLCIARVLLVRPPMLILDEATSSIDTRTELYIQSAFEQMMKGRTSFIVAHRLSTIKSADCILVMRDGHIVEQGTHEQLIETGGFYAALYNSQFAGGKAL